MSLDGYYIEDLTEGMTAVFGKTITDADILMFAGVSGDTNPVHLNEEFAAGTSFQGRIAHGMLTASLISTVLGTKLPGPGCIYLSQTLKFMAPVRSGDTVRAEVTITSIDRERRRVVFATVCKVGGKNVLEGEALTMVSRRPVARPRPERERPAVALSLFAHPFSSYCQKVLVALYENATPFTFRLLDQGDPATFAEFAALWPLRRFPLLLDGDRPIAEATVIVEHLDLHHPGPVRLIPADRAAALEVRFLDRFFDNYVHTPMQKIVLDAMRGEGEHDPRGVAEAHDPARSVLWLAGAAPGGPRLGRGRLRPRRLCGGTRPVLRRLGASDRPGLPGGARLSGAAQRPALLRAGDRGGAALSPPLSARGTRSGLSAHPRSPLFTGRWPHGT